MNDGELKELIRIGEIKKGTVLKVTGDLFNMPPKKINGELYRFDVYAYLKSYEVDLTDPWTPIFLHLEACFDSNTRCTEKANCYADRVLDYYNNPKKTQEESKSPYITHKAPLDFMSNKSILFSKKAPDPLPISSPGIRFNFETTIPREYPTEDRLPDVIPKNDHKDRELKDIFKSYGRY